MSTVGHYSDCGYTCRLVWEMRMGNWLGSGKIKTLLDRGVYNPWVYPIGYKKYPLVNII